MDNHAFEYTYSAQRQQEVEKIRKVYLPKEEDPMEQLRRLHAIPTQKAQAVSIALGAGMRLCMRELSALAMVVGIAGIVLICLAYPVFLRTLKKEREKIAPEILKLTDTLLQ